MSEPVVVRTESLGGSPLSRAARSGELPQWYRSAPGDADQWTQYVRDVAGSVSEDWLTALRSAIAPKGAALARVSASAGGKGVVITTGQQPGLFGGPLMTLVKAISARALADVVAERTGVPVAPLFWAATDDADFEEAAGVSVAVEGGVKELRLEQRAPAGTPMARVAIDREIVQYDLQGTMIRFERYPRMDDLVEVEGEPEEIERAIAILGLPRAGFNTDRLPDFVMRFEQRTGERALISDADLSGESTFDHSNA